MTKYDENMFAEYREIKGLRNGNVISLSKREYARLKSTLDILEIGGYIIDLKIDGGHIYATDEIFDFFEENMKEELGDISMTRRPDYSDLANFKTPTQIRKENQENSIRDDIEKIEVAIDSDDENQMKRVHMTVDAKYSSYVPNWGHSMYAYFDKHGFDYEFLDKDSLIHNLIHMKASLEGYMCVFPGTKKRTTQSSGDGEATMQTMRTENASSKRVFIVHGHDNEAKQETARTLEKAGYEAIILHEQPNLGNTIMEKLERCTDVDYAIVLYTECDLGRAKEASEAEEKYRARQNVVYEHGYLIGKLGREKVFALVKGDVETPGDISGVVYTPMDSAGAWKISLAKDMREAGLEIDMNKWV